MQELKRSNANLEEFAYAASHDLKEPIRKIHFFSDKLKGEIMDQLSKDQLKHFERLESATNRMRTLIEDLLSYSQVSLRPKVWEEVPLDFVVRIVLSDLELEITECNATMQVQPLPVVKGHMHQLQQLFKTS